MLAEGVGCAEAVTALGFPEAAGPASVICAGLAAKGISARAIAARLWPTVQKYL
ncbi:MAG: hypothetical protein M1582_05160 [Actinobacteria bacterium]|jgi:hypothetical protein|nr:hypothetical protein [Actinomycetota bacterium]